VAEVDVDELGGVGERGRDDTSEPVVSGITRLQRKAASDLGRDVAGEAVVEDIEATKLREEAEREQVMP
jgi:hypothetical protein